MVMREGSLCQCLKACEDMCPLREHQSESLLQLALVSRDLLVQGIEKEAVLGGKGTRLPSIVAAML